MRKVLKVLPASKVLECKSWGTQAELFSLFKRVAFLLAVSFLAILSLHWPSTTGSLHKIYFKLEVLLVIKWKIMFFLGSPICCGGSEHIIRFLDNPGTVFELRLWFRRCILSFIIKLRKTGSVSSPGNPLLREILLRVFFFFSWNGLKRWWYKD